MGQNADEKGCPGRFYCYNHLENVSNLSNRTMWIPAHKKCDQVKDCPNSMDECNIDCDLGNIASPKSLIKSNALSCLNVIFGLAVLILNVRNGFKAMKSKPSNLIAKTDRLLCIQIFVYDFIMGIYLCFIVLASLVLRYKGDYCVLSDWWRSSVYCDILGVIFSFATHGSLLIVSLLSIVRRGGYQWHKWHNGELANKNFHLCHEILCHLMQFYAIFLHSMPFEI